MKRRAFVETAAVAGATAIISSCAKGQTEEVQKEAAIIQETKQGTGTQLVQASESPPAEVPDFASEMLHSDMDAGLFHSRKR